MTNALRENDVISMAAVLFSELMLTFVLVSNLDPLRPPELLFVHPRCRRESRTVVREMQKCHPYRFARRGSSPAESRGVKKAFHGFLKIVSEVS